MSSTKIKFIKKSKSIVYDLKHRKIINHNISKYEAAVRNGKNQYLFLEKAKEIAKNIKLHTINNLDKYLLEFEQNFKKNGGKIHWAIDSKEANKIISEILISNNIDLVVKSKSMITEEIELNENLRKNNIEVVETDLGEYIVQLAGEKPYHIVTPVMHKSKEDIAKLFNQKFNLSDDSSPEKITNYVRENLREKFLIAGAGISGANFLLSDIGGICITENEGNGYLTISLPKIHIAISGIEKILPSVNDLNIFWPLLATHGTGQKLTAYNNIITGPKKNSDTDGPEQVHLILLDNGRTNIIKENMHFKALSCIKCGACLNACPVYKNIGGYTYDSVYSGPIGSVINPYLNNFEKYVHLSFASTLCGKCKEDCPVCIDIPDLLLETRKKFIEKNLDSKSEKMAINIYTKTMKYSTVYKLFGHNIKNFVFPLVLKKAWGKKKKFPKFAKIPFSKTS